MKAKKIKEKKGNIDELRWVRLFTSSHIPTYLVEQIAKREYEVKDFYQHLEERTLIGSPNGPVLNPLVHLWALVNPENLVKGFTWFEIDPLSKNIFIQSYSVDSHYWGSKEAVLKLVKHLKDILKKGKLNKVFWITKFPKHSMKYGFKSSKSILMEYKEEEEDGRNNGGNSGDDESTDTPTEPVL